MSIRIYIGNLPQGFNPKEFDKLLKSGVPGYAITIEKNAHLINPDVEVILEDVLKEINLPYSLTDFQRVAVNTVCSFKGTSLQN